MPGSSQEPSSTATAHHPHAPRTGAPPAGPCRRAGDEPHNVFIPSVVTPSDPPRSLSSTSSPSPRKTPSAVVHDTPGPSAVRPTAPLEQITEAAGVAVHGAGSGPWPPSAPPDARPHRGWLTSHCSTNLSLHRPIGIPEARAATPGRPHLRHVGHPRQPSGASLLLAT